MIKLKDLKMMLLLKGMDEQEIDNHRTDLYIKKNDISTNVINQYESKSQVSTFVDNIGNELWYDVPFAFIDISFGSDLDRKGNIEAIEKMKQLQGIKEKESKGNLQGAFISKGYHNNYDVIAMLPQSKEYEKEQGYIFYDTIKKQAFFIADEKIENL